MLLILIKNFEIVLWFCSQIKQNAPRSTFTKRRLLYLVHSQRTSVPKWGVNKGYVWTISFSIDPPVVWPYTPYFQIHTEHIFDSIFRKISNIIRFFIEIDNNANRTIFNKLQVHMFQMFNTEDIQKKIIVIKV